MSIIIKVSSRENMWFCEYRLKYWHMLYCVVLSSCYITIEFKSIVLECFCKRFSRELGKYSRKWILRVGQPAFEIRLVFLGKFFIFSEPYFSLFVNWGYCGRHYLSTLVNMTFLRYKGEHERNWEVGEEGQEELEKGEGKTAKNTQVTH